MPTPFQLEVLRLVARDGAHVFDHGGRAIGMWVGNTYVPSPTARWIADSGLIQPVPGRHDGAYELSPEGRAAVAGDS